MDDNFQVGLWKSDGTEAGTQFIKTIGNNNIYISNKVTANANGVLYFLSDDSKLWLSDGTTDGTHPIEDNNLQNVGFNYFFYSGLNGLVRAGDQLFLQGNTTSYGQELYADRVSTVLSVTLLNFIGKLVSGNGVLQWSTASEHNSSHFVLERSINGRDYYPITTVAAAGNTNYTSRYSYTDSNIIKLGVADVYYRLQQVDKDGKTTVSPVVKLSINNHTLIITAAPNPVEDKLNLTISSGTNMRAQVVVINAAGKEILQDASRIISAGTGSINYNASSWSPGIYFVKFIFSDGSTQVVKVLKK